MTPEENKMRWYTVRPEFIEGPFLILVAAAVALLAGLRLGGLL